MGKRCAYGLCKSDSRYSHKDHMKGVFFIPFVKPLRHRAKCERWINACNRVNFSVDNINRNTYVCSLHFIGGKGPTKEHPDPIPAGYTFEQVSVEPCLTDLYQCLSTSMTNYCIHAQYNLVTDQMSAFFAY